MGKCNKSIRELTKTNLIDETNAKNELKRQKIGFKLLKTIQKIEVK